MNALGPALTGDAIIATATGFMLVALRLLGLFLSAPMLAYRAVPLRIRLLVVLVLALALLPTVKLPTTGLGAPTYLAALIEVMTGVTIGFIVRLGMIAIDLAAEVLSMQTGLSFAATYSRDAALPSGIVGEMLGMTALALTLVLDIHLVLLDMLIRSYSVVPFGTFPEAFSGPAIISLAMNAFRLGAVLALPMIVVYMLFYVMQGILGRTSPQLNLFSVGFAISVPMGLLVLALMLPDLPNFVQRLFEPVFILLRHGLESPLLR